METSSSVLLLDDGELEDIYTLLQELDVACARVRGGAIVQGTPPPKDLLIATPRRIDAVEETLESCAEPPIRVMVVQEDSNALRERLRRHGFDYLVRRPVHTEALRLLLLHCIFKGEEKRRDQRVTVGRDIQYRTGLLNRRATLVDLSARGCRLIARSRIAVGKLLRLQIPEALDTGTPLQLRGRVMRAESLERGETLYAMGIEFDHVGIEVSKALQTILQDRQRGPATLRNGADVLSRPTETVTETPAECSDTPHEPRGGPPLETAEPGAQTPSVAEGADLDKPEFEVDFQVDLDEMEAAAMAATGDDTSLFRSEAESEEASDGSERRIHRRSHYQQTIPAFGNRALRVLVGRDLSVGGMRIGKLEGLEIGDRLHLAVYGEPGEEPLLIWGSIVRDDGEEGMGVSFETLDEASAAKLEALVSDLPAVESLHDSEVQAMGTVITEIVGTSDSG